MSKTRPLLLASSGSARFPPFEERSLTGGIVNLLQTPASVAEYSKEIVLERDDRVRIVYHLGLRTCSRPSLSRLITK
ncbi:hypothetical protein VTH06DRAFT_6115 [Thermothelomyces fergusii]